VPATAAPACAAAMRAMARRADEGGGLVTPFDPAG
jgi:hypothetical protein